jgi:DNA repair exonuclease SbcCD ATPase subunit
VLVIGFAAGHASAIRLTDTPMARVVGLLKDMQTKIKDDGKAEQKSYDKLSCWCEDTMSEKSEAITKAKDKIEELQTRVVKNKGFLGGNGADIGQLKKDIGKNIESQKEATEVRKKEKGAYEEDRVELEQSIGALEAAVKVLTGAGAGKKDKKGFLETYHEAQLLSIVAGVRGVLNAPHAKTSMSNKELRIVQHFVEKPDDFVTKSSALQVGNNPFGDYAPQSTQIQGILKSQYDSFTSDLEKDNAEEGEKQKSYEELMETKKKELKILQDELESALKSDAEKTKQVADDKAMLDETKEKLESDEEFFASTTATCKNKAKQWDSRSRLRTMELAGIAKAIEILDSDDAKKTFKEATSFLQIAAPVRHGAHGVSRVAGYKRLKSLASRFQNLKLAQIAVSLKTGGHFDDVIVKIDEMIGILREEAQEDIAHRDRCEGKQNANKNSKEDAEGEISKAKDKIENLKDAIKDKKDEIKEIEKDMEKTKETMDEMTKKRKEETDDFKKVVKADEDAIALLDEASAELAKYYDANKLLQLESFAASRDNFLKLSEPNQVNGTVKLAAAKPKPETNWDAEGGSRKGEAGAARGVLEILAMLKEDLQKEIKSARQDEVDAQVEYEKVLLDLERGYRASKKSKLKAESELSDLKVEKADTTEYKEAKEKELEDEEKLAKAIAANCDWVKTHFDKRHEAREAEIAGLQDAKDFLAGVGTDSDLELE